MTAQPDYTEPTDCTAIQELAVPANAHWADIDPDLLVQAGFDPDAPPSKLELVKVTFTGVRGRDAWIVSAYVGARDLVGRITCSPNNTPGEVIDIIRRWIEGSPRVYLMSKMFNNGPDMPVDSQDKIVAVVALVRGDINQPRPLIRPV